MKYHIYVDDILIASFTNEQDRGYSIDALGEAFPDANFIEKDDE